MKVIIINGPNLNLIGIREPEKYGKVSFHNYLIDLKKKYSSYHIDHFQSNIEGELINKLQETGFTYDLIVLNAGGYSHTSVSILDAILAIKTPVIEVHMSNIYNREEYRAKSILSKGVSGLIIGFGLKSYDLAISTL
ncbi:MAG: 3-dehydroquinate dehydratase [Flavobacteriales bacterium]|nr:3-dehydroquinate dehydratase [Flavobacteriales bacterium]